MISPRLRVERRERLVHQQDIGIDRERAGEIDALAHAAGELAREIVLEAFEADEAAEDRACGAFSGAPERPAISGPIIALANTVRHGSRLSLWNTKPRSLPGSRTARPSSRTSPALAASSPATMRSNVVLPQPLGPTSEMNSPRCNGDVDLAQHLERVEALGQPVERELGDHVC